MCGRFTLTTDPETLAAHFALAALPLGLLPRYNIAPGQEVVAVREVEGYGRRLDPLHWGLVPSWAETPAIGHRLINARAEGAAERPAFRAAFRHRRCLIAADGFYEWQAGQDGKQPYWIGLPERQPLAFAGLWEHWQAPDGSLLESCTILTTAANAALRPIHERMPVILPPAAYAGWLDPHAAPAALQGLLRPYAGAMNLWRVGREVNSPLKESPHLLAPLRE